MMSMIRPEYSLDTSALIQAWRQLFPIDVNPTFWQWLGEQLGQGRIIAHIEVWREIERDDDDLFKWIKGYKGSFVELTSPGYEKLREILLTFGALLNLRTNRSGADPFVIALASSTDTTLITEEHATNSQKAPRIPDVCSAIGVKCFNLMVLHRAEQIVYGRS